MGAHAYSNPVLELSSEAELEATMSHLQENCRAWQELPTKQKVALLKRIRARAIKASAKLGRATAEITGFVGEGYPKTVHEDVANLNGLLIGPTISKLASSYIQQLEEIAAKGKVVAVTTSRKTSDGRNVIDRGLLQNKADVLLQGARTYVYTQTGGEVTQGREAAAEVDAARNGVAVVLGAGNQPFLSIEDVLYMLFDKHLPVLLKHHPAQKLVAPHWEYVMEPLAEAGFYQGVLADIPMTQAAVYSKRTAAVHITGSAQTYDSLLFGPGKEGAVNKAKNKPLLSVPFTCELGNVSPVFITPAKWTQEEMKKAAQTIVFGTTMNAGCNCIAPKVIVMSDAWPQASAFEELVKQHFRETPAAPCWYPGAKTRHRKFLDAHPDCKEVRSIISDGQTYGAEVLPWAMYSVRIKTEQQAATVLGLKEEFFAPALTFLRVPGDEAAVRSGEAPSATIMQHAENFLTRIPSFADKYLWGNLACSLYLPDIVKQTMPDVAETCVDNLRYGSIVINSAPFVAYMNHLGAWGGHSSPESGPANAGSGLGKLHNFAQIDNVEKQVFEFPWGATIDLGNTKIPGFLVKPLAGLVGDGFRGLWAALTP